MLTSDLVRVRFYRSEIKPRYVKADEPGTLGLAEQLIAAFDAHVGQPRGALETVLEEIRGTDTDFLLHRGLAKLLFDRCVTESAAQLAPEEIRERLFAAAAARYRADVGDAVFTFDRDEVVREVADGVLFAPQVVESWLFADLKDEQTLTAFDSCTPEWLLHRYNVALAQGVLLRATTLELTWPSAEPRHTRELLRKIKFFQLLHRFERQPDGDWRIVLDGPLSIFRSTGKYGVAMASFLPTLLHFEGWSLQATIRNKQRVDSTFKLVPAHGLQPFTRLTGQWLPEELRALPEQVTALDPEWRLDPDNELIEVGAGGVLVPDYTFVHRPTGFRVPIEVFGFWRRGALKSRLEQLRRDGPPNLLIAVSKDLAASEEHIAELPADVYVFRSQPLARQILPRLRALREVAVAAGAGKKAKRATKAAKTPV